jgi:hypothetical protein
MCSLDARCLKRQLQRVGHILGLHRRAQLPGDDVTREVVEDRRQVKLTPADDLQIGEVGLPQLVGRRRLVLELIGRLQDNEGRAGGGTARQCSTRRAGRPAQSGSSPRLHSAYASLAGCSSQAVQTATEASKISVLSYEEQAPMRQGAAAGYPRLAE